MNRHLQPVDQEPLDGMPESPPPPPTAGDLVRAWCAAYSSERGGQQPHPTLLRRVSGVCRNVGKDCAEDIDAWRTAWRAASAAGRAGKFDLVPFLADEQPRNTHAAPTATSLVRSMLAAQPTRREVDR